MSAVSSDSPETNKLVGGPLTDNTDSSCSEDQKTQDQKRLSTVQIVCGKLLYFSWLGSLSSFEVYMAVFFKQMGFGPTLMGVIFGARPLVGTIVTFFWALLGDRWRRRRLLFNLSIVCWAVMIACVGLYHPPERQDHCPEELQQCQTYNGTGSPTDLNKSCRAKDDYVDDISWIYQAHSLDKVVLALCLLVIVGEVFQSPSGVFLDACIFNMVRDTGGATNPIKTYGAVRSLGSIGWAVR